MELKEFRIAHSTLIEHYQFIEGHLEGIYAALSDKTFVEGVRDVENDGLGRLLGEIRKLEREKFATVFTKDEFDQLMDVFRRRNFWCHNCYFDLAFDRKTGGPAKVRDIQQMMQDMQDAEFWRNELFARKIELLKKKTNMLPGGLSGVSFEKPGAC